MSREIQSDPSSNHPHEHESQAFSNQVSHNRFLQDLLRVQMSKKYREEGRKCSDIYLPLYEASLRCKWKAAEAILDKYPDMNLLKGSITENGETALHIAASAKAPKKVNEFVRNLVGRMNKMDLKVENNNKSTALYLAAVAGNIESVKIMMEKDPTLDRIPGGGGEMMPLYAAVLFGNKDVAMHLYDCSKDLTNDGWNYQNRSQLLEKCVESDMFDIASKIVKKHPELGGSSNSNLLGLLARKPKAFHKNKSSNTKSNIIRRTIKLEVGNINFLLELFRRSPDLIWKVNDNNQTIFHVAVKHRQHGIYNLLYEIGAMKDMVTPLKDKDDNNMLHLAAMTTRKKNLENVSGAALQMQRELLWFEEVERMVPPSYRVMKNKDGFTPRELFTIEHQLLIDQGEQWMKSTASQCMVVATLIATIVFAAAFTVPGGYNQNDGIPMFKRKLSFVAFVVADAISLFLSSASILTFLSILTSRYAERDFVESLPMKLMLGLVTLFLSIGTMMVTFSVSFFVLYHKEMKWIPIFISLFAVIPAILYVVLQFHLLVDVFRSTYGGKYLFKPTRQVLFHYEKPQDLTNIIFES